MTPEAKQASLAARRVEKYIEEARELKLRSLSQCEEWHSEVIELAKMIQLEHLNKRKKGGK